MDVEFWGVYHREEQGGQMLALWVADFDTDAQALEFIKSQEAK